MSMKKQGNTETRSITNEEQDQKPILVDRLQLSLLKTKIIVTSTIKLKFI